MTQFGFVQRKFLIVLAPDQGTYLPVRMSFYFCCTVCVLQKSVSLQLKGRLGKMV